MHRVSNGDSKAEIKTDGTRQTWTSKKKGEITD